MKQEQKKVFGKALQWVLKGKQGFNKRMDQEAISSQENSRNKDTNTGKLMLCSKKQRAVEKNVVREVA